MISGLLEGLLTIAEPFNLLILLMGVFIGFLGGAMPGVSGTMLVILLIPITYSMDPGPAFLMLTSIYVTAVFSGSITAILFRTPGSSEAIATTLDGYPMAQKGQAGTALGIAIFSSATGGLFATLFLIFLTPVLAGFALKFSAAEYFAVAFLGLTVVASLSAGNIFRGLIAVSIGLFIATIGMDPISGVERFTFNMSSLRSGLSFDAMLIGLFAVSEVLKKCQEDHKIQKMASKVTSKLPDFNLLRRLAGVIGRSSILGLVIGILPGAGATTAALLSYSEAARWSKEPEKFGTGVPEGIAAPESAGNAAAVGAMIPLLSLGIPGSATTAVLLGAFTLHGMQPGPMMFAKQTDLMYVIFMGILLSNLFILFLAKPFISIFAKALAIPYHIMGPVILLFCIVGGYATNNSVFDVWIVLLFGVLGYFLEKIKIPVAPIVLGLVLGSLAEISFRRALQISDGDLSIFYTRPLTAVILAVAIISLFLPLIKHFRAKRASSI